MLVMMVVVLQIHNCFEHHLRPLQREARQERVRRQVGEQVCECASASASASAADTSKEIEVRQESRNFA